MNINKKIAMRILRFTLIFLFLSFAFYVSAQTNSKIADLDWKVAVTDPFMNQINELAKVSPVIGGDSESYWAANLVDSICAVSKKQPYNYYEQVALCNLAQTVISYGMSYFTAILGAYRNAEISDELLRTIPRSMSCYNQLAKDDFTHLHLLTQNTYSVTLYYAAYFHLYHLINEEDPFNSPNQVSGMNAFLLDQEEIYRLEQDTLQAFRLCSVIEQSASYITYCSMFSAFKDLELHEKTKDNLMIIARWFDSYTMPIQNELKKKSPDLSSFYMDDKAYFQFMKEATTRKVTLMGYVIEAIKHIEKARKESPSLEKE